MQMTGTQIRFEDGAGYERYMGVWSQAVGRAFLAWVAPTPGLRWLDVGCGNGAFTQLLLDHCQPTTVTGIDPSEAQLAYARARFGEAAVDLRKADAMSLPFADATFDAAVMPLVIFFVPEPPRGVAEMVRVVRSGGIVSAYAWDMPGEGFPYAGMVEELRGLGLEPPKAPNPEASRLDVLAGLWSDAGVVDVQTRALTVERTFADFVDYWETLLCAPSAGAMLKTLPAEQTAALQSALRRRFPAGADGRLTYSARAHAVTGRVA